jgi:hypothetical protein
MMRLYKNGLLEASTVDQCQQYSNADYRNSTCFNGSSLGFAIVENPFVQVNIPFIGALYDIRIYDYALPDNELMSLVAGFDNE